MFTSCYYNYVDRISSRLTSPTYFFQPPHPTKKITLSISKIEKLHPRVSLEQKLLSIFIRQFHENFPNTRYFPLEHFAIPSTSAPLQWTIPFFKRRTYCCAKSTNVTISFPANLAHAHVICCILDFHFKQVIQSVTGFW